MRRRKVCCTNIHSSPPDGREDGLVPIEVHIEYFIGSKDIHDLTVDDKPLVIGDNHIKYVQCIRTYRIY